MRPSLSVITCASSHACDSSVSLYRRTSSLTSTFLLHHSITEFVILWLHAHRDWLQRTWRSLDTESAKTVVHAFITSRVDGVVPLEPVCGSLGPSKTTADRFQRVLNAATALLSTQKFERGLTHWHWSALAQCPSRMHCRFGVYHRYLQGRAPQYLVDCCKPTTDLPVVSDRPTYYIVAASSIVGRFLYWWSDGLEITAWLYPRPDSQLRYCQNSGQQWERLFATYRYTEASCAMRYINALYLTWLGLTTRTKWTVGKIWSAL